MSISVGSCNLVNSLGSGMSQADCLNSPGAVARRREGGGGPGHLLDLCMEAGIQLKIKKKLFERHPWEVLSGHYK